MNIFKKLVQTTLLLVVFGTNIVFADDIGITSARLIQLTDTSYLFEADFNQQVIYDYEIPVFPERFTLSNPEFEDNTTWITIKTRVTCSGLALNSADEIFLPWRRNGISLTVQWMDGTINQGLFLRSMDGIHVPISVLRAEEKSLLDVSGESFSMGLNHIKFGYIHLLLIIALVLSLQKRKLFLALVLYAFGQASSMILIEFGLPGFDLLFIDMLILFLVIALSVTAIKNIAFKYLNLLLFVIGVLHGLSVGNELKVLELPLELELPALFICNLTIDLVQFGLALILTSLMPLLKSKAKLDTGFKYLIGILAVSLVSGIFMKNVLSGNNDILIQSDSQNTAALPSSSNQNAPQATTRPKAAQTMTNPVMSYLSIEPFEVRHEILVNARTVLDLLGNSHEGAKEIPIDSLVSIQERIEALFTSNISLQIDDETVKPILSRADFVTLGPGGVLIRPEPVIENLDNGIVGISFVFETETLANELSLDWGLFPENLDKVDAMTIDPFGGESFILTPDDPVLNWESTLSGYIIPQVEEIAIESPRLSVISFFIFIISIFLLLFSKKFKVEKSWVFISLAIGFVLYPFVRSPLDVDFIKQWKPSNERSATIVSGLLTNVYRSFDYRKESDVYERLAISVMGDQLTKTYIEQRKGLEIENRGGAKAKVNDVEVLEVYDVNSGMKDNFGIEVEWKISGSVSHFGHMHYRQNRYRAVIWIRPENGNWKIENIDIIDEERLM